DLRETCATLICHLRGQLRIVVEGMGIGFGCRLRLAEEVELDFLEHRLGMHRQFRERCLGLACGPADITPGQDRFAGRDITRPDLDSQRYSTHFPVVKLEPRSDPLSFVVSDSQARIDELACDLSRCGEHPCGLVRLAPDWHYDYLRRGDGRREPQSLIIT